MPEKQTLKFTIRQDGYVTEEVIGAISDECVKLTEQIDNKLGDLDTRQFKPEYYKNVSLLSNQNETTEQASVTRSTGDTSV